MRNKIFSIYLLACLLSSPALADNLKLHGLVADALTGMPVEGASIVIGENNSGTVSDNAGRFQVLFDIPGDYKIKISRIGYESKNINVSIDSLNRPEITVTLMPTLIELDNINVTAGRITEDNFQSPASVSSAIASEFSERTFSTTAEVLREEPGIMVQKTAAAHGAPIVRGLIGKYVLLLYDGIRLNRPTFRFGANQYLNTTDLNGLGRVEVVRGPSSVMYGSDAIGGTINLIPKFPPIGNGQYCFKPILVGRYSSADEGLSTSFGLYADCYPLVPVINLTYKNIGDLKAGGDVGRQSPTGWEEYDLSARISYHLNVNRTISFDYLRVRQSEVPRYDKYAGGDFETFIYEPQDRDMMAATYSVFNDEGLQSFKWNISYCLEEEGRRERKTGSEIVNESLDKIKTGGTYFQFFADTDENHRLGLGGEYYFNRLETGMDRIEGAIITPVRPTYPDDSKYYSGGMFLQDQWSLNSRIELTSGIRYSWIMLETGLEPPFGMFIESYDHLTGSLSLKYSLTKTVNMIGSWSQGFRGPNLNDIAVLKNSSSGVDIPSPGLRPEKSNNIELGLKFRNDRILMNLFVYYNRMIDLIDRVPGEYNGKTYFDENGNDIRDPEEFDVFRKDNVARAEIFGFEFDGRMQINETWRVRINFFWTKGNNISGDEPLSRIPPLMGLLSVRYNITEKFWCESFVRAAGEQVRLSARDIDDSRIEPGGTPGWVTLNLRCMYQINNLDINLSLENILNKAYKEHGSGIYSPGRNLLFSIKYKPF